MHLFHFNLAHISLGTVFYFLSLYGYAFVFLGTLFEGELILLSAGFFSYLGALNFWLVILFGFLGATIGDNIWYWIGKRAGTPLLLRYGRFFGMSAARIDRAQQYFHEHGRKTIFFSRFVFGTRISTAVIAGAVGMPNKRFFSSNVLGAGVWAIVTTVLGYLFGNSFELLRHYVRETEKALLILAVVVIIILILRFLVKPEKV